MIALLISVSSFFYSDSNQHPIDVHLKDCLAASHATMPRAHCYTTAYNAWEKDINATEKKLLSKATAAQKTILHADQTAWEKERDVAFQNIADKYNNRRGTGYIPVRIELRMQVLRKRALTLEAALHQ
ncbi:MAG: lysozyme inhibitor LprI family protein [Ferruginibacter sp.]